MITQQLAWNDIVRMRYLRQAFALSRIATYQAYTVHLLLDQSLSITREDRHSEAPGVYHGNAMGMPCIIIELRGIALQVLWNARVTAMQVLREYLWDYVAPPLCNYEFP